MLDKTGAIIGAVLRTETVEDLKIIDATDMFDDVMIYYGLPMPTHLNGHVDLDLVWKERDKSNDVTYEEFMRASQVSLDVANVLFPALPMLYANGPGGKFAQLRDERPEQLARCMMNVMNYLRVNQDMALMEQLSAYCDAMLLEFMPSGDDDLSYAMEHNPEMARKMQDERKKYPWHMPYDRCIIAMHEIAFVYKRTERDVALMTLYSLNDRKEAVPVYQICMKLDRHGNFLKTIWYEDSDDAMPFADSIAETKNKTYFNPVGMFCSPMLMDIFSEIESIGRLFRSCDQRSLDPYRERFGALFEFAEFSENIVKMMHSDRDVALRTLIGPLTGRKDMMPTDDDVRDFSMYIADMFKLVQAPIYTALTMSVMFMTCRQVRLRECRTNVPNPKYRQRRKSGKGRRGATPGSPYTQITYSTVSVHMEDQLDPRYLDEDAGQVEPIEGAHRAPHFRRGNFALYTEERPLFGRFVGLVWRPTSVVNGYFADQGTDIIKRTDYNVGYAEKIWKKEKKDKGKKKKSK